ncbi:uncharacterized protein LOC134716580 [Mytilus trossulus]|uniref:uncharacterized protein LOC134716580 n=1 Tax=Mytilus trossulus TaxID=6551 RepID=UPI003003FA41
MGERTKKDREKVENMAPTKQTVHKKRTERIGSRRSQKFEIEYDTVEYVNRTGNELLANWKCLIQEKEEAIHTTSNKLQNMQPSKLSENRLRQEIEQWIDFIEADRHVMKRCMHNLQISMKERLHYLRTQKQFFLDKQKTLKNVYKTIERSNRSRIQNPFSKFLLHVKREHNQLFNEELLISSNGSLNKYKRKMTEANAVIIDDTTLYIGRTGRTRVMTPIHENILESDKCITGECVDSCCTLRRSESELSFLNHELEVEYEMFELSMKSKETENYSRKEETQRNELQKHAKRSKISLTVKLPQLLGKEKMKYEEKYPSTPVKLPLLLPNKNLKYVEELYSETLKRQPLLPNKKMIYAKELHETTLKLPPVFPDKEQTCVQEHPFTNRPGTHKLLPPLQHLPQNSKKKLIVNKIRDEKKDKSKHMSTESMSKPAPQQPDETTASNEIFDMSLELGSIRPKWKNQYRNFRLQKTSRKINYASNRKYRFSRLHLSSDEKCFIPKSKSDNEKKEKSEVIPTQSTSISAPQKTNETTTNGGALDMNSELALKRINWENKFPTFRLQKTSSKDRYISERKYRFSRLHKASDKCCYIPKSKIEKVCKIVTGKYCARERQKKDVKKQTYIENPDSYPEPDQVHTWSLNLKKMLIVKKMSNEKKDKSEVVKSVPLSSPEQTDETTASHKMSKSKQQQANETIASNKMSKPEPEQIFENIREQIEREKSVSNSEEDQYDRTMMDIAVGDTYPTEDIFNKLDDNELIGFYQVQEKDLFPVIENMSYSKAIEVFKKLHDKYIAVIQSISDTLDDIQSSSSESTIGDFEGAGENGGTLKSAMKTFVKKLIPDCITNGNQSQPTETLSSNWQIIKVLSGTNIKTQTIHMSPAQFNPMPPNAPKPKTSNARRNRYRIKMDENNNPPDSQN